VGGVTLGNDPVGKEPKLLNLCIATPNSYSLSNRLSPSPSVLFFPILPTSFQLFPPIPPCVLQSIVITVAGGLGVFSPTYPPSLIQHEHNTRHAFPSFEDSNLGFTNETAFQDELATILAVPSILTDYLPLG
jgi:hypothetical protein